MCQKCKFQPSSSHCCKRKKRAIIIDICCPFDNGSETLSDAENLKLSKYEVLKQFFTSQGIHCDVYGFVVGAPGTWYPRNEATLHALRMTCLYKSLCRKLCYTDAIQGSTNILRQHMGLDDLERILITLIILNHLIQHLPNKSPPPTSNNKVILP